MSSRSARRPSPESSGRPEQAAVVDDVGGAVGLEENLDAAGAVVVDDPVGAVLHARRAVGGQVQRQRDGLAGAGVAEGDVGGGTLRRAVEGLPGGAPGEALAGGAARVVEAVAGAGAGRHVV